MARIVERHRVIRDLLRALRTKRFLILAGISGTGKTQLARRLAASITAVDRVDGNGRGFALVEEALDRAVAGEPNFLFEPIPGHPDHVHVVDVGSGGEHARADALFDRRVGFVPVRPDWTDSKRLLGYYNPLTGRYYPTDVLVVLLNAWREFAEHGDEAGSHFIVLDEMNLARVEYYLADLLSLMESGASVDPDHPDRVRLGELARVHPLDTLVVSQGTRGVHDQRSEAEAQAAFANVDTGGKRVMGAARTGTLEQLVPLRELDERRFVYEALVRGQEFITRPKQPLPPLDPVRHALALLYPIPPRIAFPPNVTLIGTINVDETTHGLSPKVLDRAFVLEFSEVSYAAALGSHPEFSSVGPHLEALHAALEPSTLHFGYRVAHEILEYVAGAPTAPLAESMDFLLTSKVLPKLRGPESTLGEAVSALLNYTRAHGLPRAERKLVAMQRQLEHHGYASFF